MHEDSRTGLHHGSPWFLIVLPLFIGFGAGALITFFIKLFGYLLPLEFYIMLRYPVIIFLGAVLSLLYSLMHRTTVEVTKDSLLIRRIGKNQTFYLIATSCQKQKLIFM